MNKRPTTVLWGENVIGNVSVYPALPNVVCHRCGSKLHRVYNTQTDWKYLCKEEKILVDLEDIQQTLQVEIE